MRGKVTEKTKKKISVDARVVVVSVQARRRESVRA